MALLQEIKVPLLAVNDTTLTVVEIVFANGQQIKKGDRIMVFETSKTTYEVEAEENGYIQYLCEIDHDYNVNEIVAKIFSEANEVEKIAQNISTNNVPAAKEIINNKIETWKGETLFSAEALLIIESSKADKNIFAGKDFVNKQDVEEALGLTKKIPVKENKAVVANPIKSKSVLSIDSSKVIVEKLSSNKKREIEYLSEVQSTGLTSTINVVIETEGIFTHINQSLKYLKDSLLPVIIYETGRLLKKYPLLNAYFTGEAIAYYNSVHVGFAIDIDKGLKVLKVANTNEKSIADIEDSIINLSNSYLDDKLQLEDLIDITFTITDLSSEGVAFFRPLVNMMNSAILGVSAIDQKLNRCTLSVTFDHRVTEGKVVAQFLSNLKERLESYQSKYYSNSNQNINCYKCYKKLSEDLGDVGFVKCITPAGKEDYICQSCLKGF